MKGTRIRCSLVFAAMLAGVSATADAQPKLATDPSLTTSDNALLKDEAKAIAELQRRLRLQVTYRNGVLVIIDRGGSGGGVTVMPASVMWGIDCSDSGLTVTFGAGTGETENGIALQLTSSSISDDKCTRIAPAIGEAALDITKGN